jgi:hypothetical protein
MTKESKENPPEQVNSTFALPPKDFKGVELPVSSEYFKNLGETVNKSDLDQLAINVDENKLTQEECQGIIEILSRTHALTKEEAFTATCLLILKGAANEGAPRTMKVQIKASNQIVEVTKNDLIYAVSVVCKNFYIRRLAETLCVEISQFAEKHGLNGDLAITLNNTLMAKGFPPLTSKERAWASSFNQNLVSLVDVVGPRVPTLLAEDYQRRFQKNGNKQKSKKTKRFRTT